MIDLASPGMRGDRLELSIVFYFSNHHYLSALKGTPNTAFKAGLA